VVAAAEAAHGAAVRVDGQMIDKPLISQARRILATARSQGAQR
jgi:citrate lyase beta subunit